MSYVGNGALLIGGTLLVATADGKPLVELGIPSAFAQMVASDTSVLVAFRDGSTPVGVLSVAFDPKKIPGVPGRVAPLAPAAPKPAPAAGAAAPKAPAVQ